MKIAIKVVFASALMLSVVAPTLSHAAYFVDQTKTWALIGEPGHETTTNTSAQNDMGKKVHVDRHARRR